jgi:hypothetical protein
MPLNFAAEMLSRAVVLENMERVVQWVKSLVFFEPHYRKLGNWRQLLMITLTVWWTSSMGSQVDDVQLQSILNLLQKKEYLSSHTDEYREVFTDLISRSGSKLTLNINDGLREGAINFLLIAPDVNEHTDLPLLLFAPLAQDILHNCNFVGIQNTIVCSEDTLDGLFERYLKDQVDVHYPPKHPPGPNDLTISSAKRAFLFWVVGHELGHMAHGDVDSHFATSLGLQELASTDELQQEKELRADAYCADLAVKASSNSKHSTSVKILEQILIALANAEVITRHLSKGEGPGLLKYYSSTELIEYEKHGDHPEFVVRATRMLKVLAALTKDDALGAMTDSFESHLRESDLKGQH